MKKGPRWEAQCVAYLQDFGFPAAERRVMGGARDRGDVAGIPGLVIECKNQDRQTLSEWVNEAEEEAAHAGDIGVVWHKRRGKSSPGDCYVTMTGAVFLELLKAWTK